MSKTPSRRRVRAWLATILICAQAHPAWSQILVRAPGAARTDFRATHAIHPELRRLTVDAPDTDASLDIAKEKLNRALERAQIAFLSGTLEEARAGFADVAKLATTADWARAQRRAIHHAILRTAQMASGEASERRDALAKAVAFDPEAKADPAKFPPPLLAELEAVRRESDERAVLLKIRERFDGYETLIVNGRAYKVADTGVLKLRPGDYRIHLRSDVYAPVAEVMSAAKLFIYTAPRRPIAAGTCGRPGLNEPALAALEITVVYSRDCLQRYRSGQWTRLTGEEGGPARSDPWTTSPSIPASLEIPESPLEPKPVYRKGWFWGGIAGIAAVAIALSAKRAGSPSETEIRPSNAEGF